MVPFYFLFMLCASSIIRGDPVNKGADDSTLKDVVSTLLNRIDTMEAKFNNMQQHMYRLESKESLHLKEIETLKETNHMLKSRLSQLENKIFASDDAKIPTEQSTAEDRKPKDDETADSFNEMNARKNVPDDEHSSSEKHISSRLVLAEGPVAFCATLNQPAQEAHLGINQPIKFDTVVTNVGGGFHSAHGIFTAPQTGIYLISASVMSYINIEVRSTITVNGSGVANIFSRGNDGRHEQGTQVIVIQLNQGDDVAVENIDLKDTSIWGDKYTSFSGYLLYPM